MTDGRLRISDLAPAEWRGFEQFLANGCGGKGGLIRPPQFKFGASCDRHDFGYWVGGSKHDRLRVDARFFGAMVTDAALLPMWRRPIHLFFAWLYFRAVRICGRSYWHEGEPRTRSDLADELDMAMVVVDAWNDEA